MEKVEIITIYTFEKDGKPYMTWLYMVSHYDASLVATRHNCLIVANTFHKVGPDRYVNPILKG